MFKTIQVIQKNTHMIYITHITHITYIHNSYYLHNSCFEVYFLKLINKFFYIYIYIFLYIKIVNIYYNIRNNS